MTFVGSKDYDLTKIEDTNKMFEDHNPSVVVHLAARVGGIMDNINNPFEYYEDNVLMNTNIIRVSRKRNLDKFLCVLSSCAYPDVVDTYPMKESDFFVGEPNINNYGYGYSKRMMAAHVNIARKEGLNYSYITPSNLYGEYEKGDENKRHFVGSLLEKIADANKKGLDKITLFGDGSPMRQFTFAKDVAEIVNLIVTYDVKENMNISNPENLTIDQMARLALKATNSEHLKIEYDTTKPNGQYRKDISVDTFKNIFPNYEFISYIEGVKLVYEKIKSKYGI